VSLIVSGLRHAGRRAWHADARSCSHGDTHA
jgi:hypothetical protein